MDGEPSPIRLREIVAIRTIADNTGDGAVLALIEGGFVVIFFEAQWSNWEFRRKCALLISWWPVILPKSSEQRRYHSIVVPLTGAADSKLRGVSNNDSKLLKIEPGGGVQA
jgi:hypothetical protein